MPRQEARRFPQRSRSWAGRRQISKFVDRLVRDALNVDQVVDRAKRNVLFAIRDDPGGDDFADTRQTFELFDGRGVDVDPGLGIPGSSGTVDPSWERTGVLPGTGRARI